MFFIVLPKPLRHATAPLRHATATPSTPPPPPMTRSFLPSERLHDSLPFAALVGQTDPVHPEGTGDGAEEPGDEEPAEATAS